MPFNTLGLSAATVGMATLAFAITAPASAKRTAHIPTWACSLCACRLSPLFPLWRGPSDHRSFATAGSAAWSYAWGPVGAVGSVVTGTGQAVGAVFYGAGGIVGGVVGGVFGGVSALFGGPGYTYTPTNGYGGPFSAPFNAGGAVAVAPFQVVGGAFGATPPAAY